MLLCVIKIVSDLNGVCTGYKSLKLRIHTDSMFVFNGATDWIPNKVIQLQFIQFVEIIFLFFEVEI